MTLQTRCNPIPRATLSMGYGGLMRGSLTTQLGLRLMTFQSRPISTQHHPSPGTTSSTGSSGAGGSGSSSPTLGVIPKPPSPATLRSVVTRKMEKQRADETTLAERLALHQTVLTAAEGGGGGDQLEVGTSPAAEPKSAAAAPSAPSRVAPLPSTIFRRDAVPDEIRILRDRTILRLRWSTEDGEVDAHPAEAALRQVMPESTSTVLGTIAGPTTSPGPVGAHTAAGTNSELPKEPAPTPTSSESSSSAPGGVSSTAAAKLQETEPQPAKPEPIVLQYQFQAEFLRARSPSTDVLGSPNVLIYGKRGLYIKELYPVGSYAIRIIFSDGHDAGIFPYAFLRELGETKFANYRLYLKQLREARKIRDAPVRRAKSTLPRPLSAGPATSNSGGCGANRTH